MLGGDLTYDELDMVIQGLDALANRDSSNAFMSEMMGAMLKKPGMTPEEKEAEKTAMQQRLAEVTKKGEVLKRRLTILKAKILTLQEEMLPQEVRA